MRTTRTTQANFLFVPQQAIEETTPRTIGSQQHEDVRFALGDPVLAAMRDALSLAYLNRLNLSQIHQQLPTIRSVASSALSPLAELLKVMNLAPAGSAGSSNEVNIFKLVIAPTHFIASTRINPSSCLPADPAIKQLRKVLSMTFEEHHDVLGYGQILKRIQRELSKTLFSYNVLLAYLDIELVNERSTLAAQMTQSQLL